MIAFPGVTSGLTFPILLNVLNVLIFIHGLNFVSMLLRNKSLGESSYMKIISDKVIHGRITIPRLITFQ